MYWDKRFHKYRDVQVPAAGHLPPPTENTVIGGGGEGPSATSKACSREGRAGGAKNNGRELQEKATRLAFRLA